MILFKHCIGRLRDCFDYSSRLSNSNLVFYQRFSEEEQRIVVSERSNSGMKEQLARHEAEIEQRNARIDQLESQLHRKTEEINRFKLDHDRLAQEVCASRSELKQSTSRLDLMENDKLATEENSSRTKVELDKVTAELSSLRLNQQKHLSLVSGMTQALTAELTSLRCYTSSLRPKVASGATEQRERLDKMKQKVNIEHYTFTLATRDSSATTASVWTHFSSKSEVKG